MRIPTYPFIIAGLIALSSVAQATVVNLSVTGSWIADDYDVTSTLFGDDDKVFGTSASDGSTSFTLRVDTSSAVSFTTGYAGITHDWFGYSNVTLLGTHTFGDASWTTGGIVTGLVGVDGLKKALWTDTDIATADPTRLSFRMFGDWPGGSADIFVGSRTTTTIGDTFLMWEYYAGEEIRSSSYTASVASVPEPATLSLLALGIAGMAFSNRRRQRNG